MLAGDAWADNDLVFCNEDGTQLHPDRVSDAFDRAVAKAGVPRIPFKNMRHTHATLGLLAGVDLKIMSARLGHASVSITADVYQQVIDGMDEDAARRIGALVFRTKRTRG